MVDRIGQLYKIEARIRGRDAQTRAAVRQRLSRPIVEALRPCLEAQLELLPSSSDLARHIRYGLKRWHGLTRFLADGRLEMDTNAVENAIRPVPLTRKNALFAGSNDGAVTWARMASLIGTCKLNAVRSRRSAQGWVGTSRAPDRTPPTGAWRANARHLPEYSPLSGARGAGRGRIGYSYALWLWVMRSPAYAAVVRLRSRQDIRWDDGVTGCLSSNGRTTGGARRPEPSRFRQPTNVPRRVFVSAVRTGWAAKAILARTYFGAGFFQKKATGYRKRRLARRRRISWWDGLSTPRPSLS